MEHGTDFIKIRTALSINRKLDLTSNGFSQEFLDKLTVYEEKFRSQIMVPINEAVGLHNWAIQFIEFGQSPPKFLCDIYSDDKLHFNGIMAIVKNRIQDVEFEFSYKGTIRDYLTE